MVALLRADLKQTGAEYGALFRAEQDFRGGASRYQFVQEKWALYCQKAGSARTLHYPRHAHANELVKDGVSLNTIRKRLGHQKLQTTLRYAEESDDTDAELRTGRRRHDQGR